MNLSKLYNSGRSFVARHADRIAAGLALLAVSGAASAQATLDVTSVTAEIASGVVAMGIIGVAWVGFKYLKKVWNKI